MRLIRENAPDLVVLDVMMPGMSGWEICKAIREDGDLSSIGIIMLTGIGERLNEMTSPLYGADAHLDKPFELSALDEAVTRVLGERGVKASRAAH
jgi:DNA-binding response OmpR family regulator